MHAISWGYRTVFISWLVTSYGTHKDRRLNSDPQTTRKKWLQLCHCSLKHSTTTHCINAFASATAPLMVIEVTSSIPGEDTRGCGLLCSLQETSKGCCPVVVLGTGQSIRSPVANTIVCSLLWSAVNRSCSLVYFIGVAESSWQLTTNNGCITLATTRTMFIPLHLLLLLSYSSHTCQCSVGTCHCHAALFSITHISQPLFTSTIASTTEQIFILTHLPLPFGSCSPSLAKVHAWK